MPRQTPRGAKLGPRLARPFYTSVLIITLIATYSLFARKYGGAHDGGGQNLASAPLLQRRSHKDEDCQLVHQAKDQCAFILANCQDDEAGLLSYLTFYYCSMARVQPIAFILMVMLLGLLFTTIGIAASDFFSVNLNTIASILGLSESLAGVTFLAFGNGSPDVFSTFAAMGSNSGSMAVGELIGAAGFITAVVAGAMALVREFKVSKRTFVRDVCFFIVAVSFTMVFLADGQLHLWECCTMIGFYVFYVMIVVGWHYWSTRRRRRRQKEAASRGHFYGAVNQPSDELEPYRDEEDGDAGDETVGRGGRNSDNGPQDISALERGPRIEVGGGDQLEDEDEEDSDREAHVVAEMTSSMRINRPRGVRSNTTLGQIRPSLAGVIEFRSVLSSLQKSGNVRLARMHHSRVNSETTTPAMGHHHTASLDYFGGERNLLSPDGGRGGATAAVGRDRARSHGDLPLAWDNNAPAGLRSYATQAPEIVTQPPMSPPRELTSEQAFEAFQPPSRTTSAKDGSLAPPPSESYRRPHPSTAASPPRHASPDLKPSQGALPEAAAAPSSPASLRLHIPNTREGQSSGTSSPSLSPFPGLSESPLPMTPNVNSPLLLPRDSGGREPAYFGVEIQDHPSKPVKWWPYNVLPPPYILLSTLFPTLQGWADKSVWDKFVSVICIPSIFILVITLPVVESEVLDDESQDDTAVVIVDPPHTGEAGHTGMPVSVEHEGSIQPETEWQRYRRNKRSSSTRHSGRTSPLLLDLGGPPDSDHHHNHNHHHHHHHHNHSQQDSQFTQLPPATIGRASDGMASDGAPDAAALAERLADNNMINTKPNADQSRLSHNESETQASDSPLVWNRWLVAIQVFTGPLFTVFVVWANMQDDLEQPSRTLVKMVLYSLIFSLVLLAILLSTTSPDVRPKYHFLFCFLGFIISIAWISTIAGEVVGVLKAFGVILGISEAILGLTIFAVGNSLGDLVADITVARLGYPVMALSACFGGPMLNILLGVGIGGAWMAIKSANEKHKKHPDRPLQYEPYHIQVGGTLLISAITVLVTLVALLIAVPSNKWMMTRKIGWSLIAIWGVSTVINLVIEVMGVWKDVA